MRSTKTSLVEQIMILTNAIEGAKRKDDTFLDSSFGLALKEIIGKVTDTVLANKPIPRQLLKELDQRSSWVEQFVLLNNELDWLAFEHLYKLQELFT